MTLPNYCQPLKKLRSHIQEELPFLIKWSKKVSISQDFYYSSFGSGSGAELKHSRDFQKYDYTS